MSELTDKMWLKGGLEYPLEAAEEEDFLGSSSVCQMHEEALQGHFIATIPREVLRAASGDGSVDWRIPCLTLKN